MKKLMAILCILLAAAMLGSTAATAATVDAEVYAVGANGERISGVPDPDQLENDGEYSLMVGSKEVMTVGETQAVGRYYHVEFDIPDTTETVYLAGLTADNVEEIQAEIIQSYVSGQPFDMTNLGFIDAEKVSLNNTDSNLCWAASTADLLAYTGWAKQAGFQNEDEVMQLFADSYSNNGGHAYYGLAWFFNHASMTGNSGAVAAKVLDYPNSGGYLRNYAFDMVATEGWLHTGADLKMLLDHIKAGDGCGLGVIIKRKGTATGSGGHAITGWGMITDSRYADTNLNHYKAIFVTDSDSDVIEGRSREDAPNIMNLHPLYVDSDGSCCFDYDDQITAEMDDVVYLTPYSKNLPKETEFGAMRNKALYPDLTFSGLKLTDNALKDMVGKTMESGTTAVLKTYVANLSDKDFNRKITLDFEIKNQDQETVLSESYALGSSLEARNNSALYTARLRNAPAGDYTVTCTVNKKHTDNEAFYYNNTRTMTFRLRDSYKLGDVNGDGTLDVQDVTMLQKYLVDYQVGWNEKAAERAAIRGDEPSIADATLIQGHLTEMETSYPIGEKTLYTMI